MYMEQELGGCWADECGMEVCYRWKILAGENAAEEKQDI